MCSQCLSHTGFDPAHGVCAFPVYTAQALGCSAGNRLEAGPGLYALPGSKLLRFRHSGTPQRHRIGWYALPRSQQLRWPGVWRAPSLRLISSPVPAARFSGCTPGTPSQADVYHPESQEVLATKPACGLVDNAPLGPRLPASGSGCLSLKGDGLQPASCVQSFVLWAGLTVS